MNTEPGFRISNVIERLNREIRRRTRVVGTFLNGNSTRMLACARLRHVANTQWSNKKYMNMKHLEAACQDAGYPDANLANLYDEITMPSELRKDPPEQ